MRDQPTEPPSPADEQRTTQVPRPSAADRARNRAGRAGDDPAPADGAAPPPQSRHTPPRSGQAPPSRPAPPGPVYQETTILQRPAGPPPASTNVPGGYRGAPPGGQPHAQPPPQQSPRPQQPSPASPPSRSTGRPPARPAGEPAAWTADDDRRTPAPRRHTSHLPPYTEPFVGRDVPPAGGGRGPTRYPDDDWSASDDRYAGDRYPGADRGDDWADPHAGPAEPLRSPGYRDTAPDHDAYDPAGLRRKPRKLTVTRVAALRSRELTHRGLVKFHGAVSADGADLSGLAHLTYAHMGNYAVDAALAVALANTLFFAAATAESTGKVLLYLLLTVAPFAVVAPFIGPALDKLQHGRRFALAASSFGRAALAITMAIKFESWVIYPCALGMLVLSKSFGVLKAALTPRVLPAAITLVKTNSRLSVFGLIAGGVSGAVAAGIAALFGSAGALGFTAACGVVGGWLCLRIPAWVESTEGEVPVHHSQQLPRLDPERRPRRVMPRAVLQALWVNGTIRIETGFLALFIAFVIKSHYEPTEVVTASGVTATPSEGGGWAQLLLLGAVGAAAGVGGFIGNGLGARLPLRRPETVALVCLCGVIVSVIVAFVFPGLITACVVALVGATASALAKVCLDSSIQQHLPEVSRASAFGRSESVLQLSWVFGGVIGLLIGGVWGLGATTVYQVGFGVVAVLLLAGAAQCVALGTGRTLVPRLRGRRRGRRAGGASAAASSGRPSGAGPGGTPGMTQGMTQQFPGAPSPSDATRSAAAGAAAPSAGGTARGRRARPAGAERSGRRATRKANGRR